MITIFDNPAKRTGFIKTFYGHFQLLGGEAVEYIFSKVDESSSLSEVIEKTVDSETEMKQLELTLIHDDNVVPPFIKKLNYEDFQKLKKALLNLFKKTHKGYLGVDKDFQLHPNYYTPDFEGCMISHTDLERGATKFIIQKPYKIKINP